MCHATLTSLHNDARRGFPEPSTTEAVNVKEIIMQPCDECTLTDSHASDCFIGEHIAREELMEQYEREETQQCV